MFNTLEMFSMLEDMEKRHAKAVEKMNMEHEIAEKERRNRDTIPNQRTKLDGIRNN